MKLAIQPRIVEVENFPPVYPTHRPLANIGKRCLKIQSLFTQRRVLFANHLILPTQIIRELLIPLLETHHRPKCLPSKLPLGNNILLCHFNSCELIYLYHHHSYVSSGIAKSSKKLKPNKPAEDPKVHEPEEQTVSESLHQTSNDPPLEVQWIPWMLT